MTVSQLIKKLKKMPQNSIVAFRDHDQRESELNGFIENVQITDFSKIKPNMWDLDDEVVVLTS